MKTGYVFPFSLTHDVIITKEAPNYRAE